MKKILSLARKYSDLIIYVILGVLTTVVNFLVYFPLLTLFSLPASVANIIAWVVAVAFAFLTNKPIAFKSYDWSPSVAFPELVKFVVCRVGSGVVETLFIMITVDILHWNGSIMKIFISVIVVLANYIASKLFVFKK